MVGNDRVPAQHGPLAVMAGIRRLADAAGLDPDDDLLLAAGRLRHFHHTAVYTARFLYSNAFMAMSFLIFH